jgi:hypothetical protein
MSRVRLVLLTALVAALTLPVFAADEVFEGTLVCAMCGLKKPDAKACQDVLLVPEASGTKREYYITKNDVAQAAGEVCTREIKATITGTLSEREGKTWLTPSKIEKHEAGEPHAHGQTHTP